MPLNNWHGPYAFIALGIVLAAVTGWISWTISAEQAEIRMGREQGLNQHIEYAQDRVLQTCVDQDRATHIECVTTEVLSALDHNRAESDLDAQLGMAFWAKLMTLVSVVGLGVTTLGVYLVWGTLDQTRQATKAAQDAVSITEKMGRIQTQAYIAFNGTEISYHLVNNVPVSLEVRAKFRNMGQSPGKIMYGFCQTGFLQDFKTPFHPKTERTNMHNRILAVSHGDTVWISSHQISISDILQNMVEGRFLVAYGHIEFTDVFDAVRRVEDFCVGLLFSSDPSKMINGVGAHHNWNAHQDYTIQMS